MNWLYQGLIINLVWTALLFLISLFSNAPINNKNEEDLYKIKLKFHVFLISLVGISSIGFFSITLYFIYKEYFQALFCIFSILLAYFLATNEFNKIFKIATSKNNNFNNKQKRSKKKST